MANKVKISNMLKSYSSMIPFGYFVYFLVFYKLRQELNSEQSRLGLRATIVINHTRDLQHLYFAIYTMNTRPSARILVTRIPIWKSLKWIRSYSSSKFQQCESWKVTHLHLASELANTSFKKKKELANTEMSSRAWTQKLDDYLQN